MLSRHVKHPAVPSKSGVAAWLLTDSLSNVKHSADPLVVGSSWLHQARESHRWEQYTSRHSTTVTCKQLSCVVFEHKYFYLLCIWVYLKEQKNDTVDSSRQHYHWLKWTWLFDTEWDTGHGAGVSSSVPCPQGACDAPREHLMVGLTLVQSDLAQLVVLLNDVQRLLHLELFHVWCFRDLSTECWDSVREHRWCLCCVQCRLNKHQVMNQALLCLQYATVVLSSDSL